LAAVDHADGKLAFAEIEHEAGAHGHTKDALDGRARRRQVAHDRLVTVVVVDHADTTEYRAPLGPVDLGSARLDLDFVVANALAELDAAHGIPLIPDQHLPGTSLAHEAELVVCLEPLHRGLLPPPRAEAADRGDDLRAVLVFPGARIDEALVHLQLV